MTTTMKKAAKKPARKNPSKRTSPFPPTAGVTKIDGRDFIIMPLDDFEEWQEDRLLAAVVGQRLASGEKTVPFEEIEARLDRNAKRRK